MAWSPLIPRRVLLAAVLLGTVLGLAAACSSLGYYTQSLRGGLEVLLARQPVDRLLARPDLDPEVRRGLETASDARGFAVAELGLPDNGSYRAYSDLGRPFALWNVVAAPELSAEPLHWCFPFAGCVSYRGYFSEPRARRYADRLRRRGLDVQVEGVTAYSTLGWFDDPLLNTFVRLPPPYLAGLVFHELAHQRLYLAGDTEFNEGFATVVERVGVERWLRSRGNSGEIAAYDHAKELQNRFVDLVLAYRSELETVYASTHGESWKRWHKRRVIAELRREFERLRSQDAGWRAYDRWFSGDIDNARLASVTAYHRFEDGFLRLLADDGGDLEAFYAACEALSKQGPEERERILAPAGSTVASSGG